MLNLFISLKQSLKNRDFSSLDNSLLSPCIGEIMVTLALDKAIAVEISP